MTTDEIETAARAHCAYLGIDYDALGLVQRDEQDCAMRAALEAAGFADDEQDGEVVASISISGTKAEWLAALRSVRDAERDIAERKDRS